MRAATIGAPARAAGSGPRCAVRAFGCTLLERLTLGGGETVERWFALR